MSDHEYSQGICGDGAAILKDGQPMTIEKIVDELRKGQAARAQSGQGVEPASPGDPLPCPFCGSSDVGGAGGTVGCYRCPAEIAVQNANTAYAVELWNNRVANQPQPAQQGSAPSRDDLIQCILATQAQSEGVMADAILSMLTTPLPAQQGSVPEDVIERCEEAIQYAAEIRGGCYSGVREAQKRVRAILTTPQPSKQEGKIPEGWKLVPVEPTTDMRHAYHGAYQRYLEGSIPSPDGQWWAMLDAAPQPEQEAEGWIKCSDRLPTEADGDFQGGVFFCGRGWIQAGYWHVEEIKAVAEENPDLVANATWKPTGLKRPQPPKEGKGDE